MYCNSKLPLNCTLVDCALNLFRLFGYDKVYIRRVTIIKSHSNKLCFANASSSGDDGKPCIFARNFPLTPQVANFFFSAIELHCILLCTNQAVAN